MKKTVWFFLTMVALFFLGLAYRKNHPAPAAVAIVPVITNQNAPVKHNTAVTVPTPAPVVAKPDESIAANPPASLTAAAIAGHGSYIASPPARINGTNFILFRSSFDKTNKEIDTRQATVIVGG
jgi:hypothetical protein